MTPPPATMTSPLVPGHAIALTHDYPDARAVLVWLRGYPEPITPDDLLTRLHNAETLAAALGEARADAAALRVELATLNARMRCFEAAAGVEEPSTDMKAI